MAAAILRKTLSRRFSKLAQLCTSISPAPHVSRVQPPIPIPPDRKLTDRILNPTRIRLDVLAPPPAMKLEQEDVRKVLRATQMEAARSRLRAAAAVKSCVSYSEFLRICSDAVGSELGIRVAKALDESGSVIVLGQTVFLRPEMEIKERVFLIGRHASLVPRSEFLHTSFF